MAQFAVHRNKSPKSKGTYPILVDVQSDLLERLQTRVVIPLTKAASIAKSPLDQLTPIVQFEANSYVLMTPQMAGISCEDLGASVGSLANQRTAIIAAIDFLITGF